MAGTQHSSINTNTHTHTHTYTVTHTYSNTAYTLNGTSLVFTGKLITQGMFAIKMYTFQTIVVYLQIILKISAIGYTLRTRMARIYKKPVDDDQILNIELTTEAQCRYTCIQNVQCLTVLWDSARNRCFGYKSRAEDETVSENMKIWHLIYQGW